jgi:hypothetical protein
MVKSPSEGEPDHFTVPIPPDLASHDRYDYLAEAIESQLGRTGLMVLVY